MIKMLVILFTFASTWSCFAQAVNPEIASPEQIETPTGSVVNPLDELPRIDSGPLQVEKRLLNLGIIDSSAPDRSLTTKILMAGYCRVPIHREADLGKGSIVLRRQGRVFISYFEAHSHL